MSSETLAEARQMLVAKLESMGLSTAERAEIAATVSCIVADAERAQREEWRAKYDMQRERADGLERTLAREAAIYKKAIAQSVSNEQATRPYRMAIARWAEAFNRGGEALGDASLALRSLITDADIEAARKEGE